MPSVLPLFLKVMSKMVLLTGDIRTLDLPKVQNVKKTIKLNKIEKMEKKQGCPIYITGFTKSIQTLYWMQSNWSNSVQ